MKLITHCILQFQEKKQTLKILSTYYFTDCLQFKNENMEVGKNWEEE